MVMQIINLYSETVTIEGEYELYRKEHHFTIENNNYI